jgi:3-dehydroquinate synthase
MSTADRITVDLGPRSYDILVGGGLIADAGTHLRPLLQRPRAIVVTDENVAALYRAPLLDSLSSAGIDSDCVVLPAGEQTKAFGHLESLIDMLLARRVERSTAVIALGGGVVGDLAGFAAAIVLRGIDFVQVPTTLLAQVDSSVGGKTGINTPRGKNLVGAFHQPRLVLADTGTLDTLPRRELLAGYAEVVKYGLIDDAAFFDWLDGNGAAILDGDEGARRHAVVAACRAKARIVADDEREEGRRALLNLGHTFAHALEAEAGYGGDLLHGEAVAIGMVLAFDLSVRLGLCPAEDAARVRRHVSEIGLPTAPPPTPGGAAALIDHMRNDKKVTAGRVAFVLARGIGKAFISVDVDLGDVKDLIDQTAAA